LHGYIVLKDVIEAFEDVLRDAIGEVGFEERECPAVGVVVAGLHPFRRHPVKVLMEQEAGHGEATVYAGVQG
jgi:hypothetical protein